MAKLIIHEVAENLIVDYTYTGKYKYKNDANHRFNQTLTFC